jgi:hypothetical protein
MSTNLIHDRGRGPEIVGTRTTVFNLLPYLLDPTATEDYICRVCELTPDQVAAARAYVLNNPEVLGENREIEERITAGNPPQMAEKAKETHAKFLSFRQWLKERESAAAHGQADELAPGNRGADSNSFPTFQEWLVQRESRSADGP